MRGKLNGCRYVEVASCLSLVVVSLLFVIGRGLSLVVVNNWLSGL